MVVAIRSQWSNYRLVGIVFGAHKTLAFWPEAGLKSTIVLPVELRGSKELRTDSQYVSTHVDGRTNSLPGSSRHAYFLLTNFLTDGIDGEKRDDLRIRRFSASCR